MKMIRKMRNFLYIFYYFNKIKILQLVDKVFESYYIFVDLKL